MQGRAIVEAIAREMQTGTLVLDQARRILFANPFFVRSFRLRGDIVGRSIEDIIFDNTLIKAIDSFSGSGECPLNEIEINDGERSFKVRIVALEEEGEARILLFVKDITEEKRVEAIKKDFVANVSHELRTPLASIKGYSETLLDGGVEDDDTRCEFLRIIDKHATRMSRLIDDLLVLSKLESHQLPIECESLDITQIISSTIASFEKQAGDKGISLGVELSGGVRNVCADCDRIEQVLVNLLDNAIKYTTQGGSVKVAVYNDGDEVRVDVKDSGMGIPTADIPRIFERFYRVDKARSRELGGTGLGLAITKHIIQVLGGRVWVESVPGEGSVFSFALKAAS